MDRINGAGHVGRKFVAEDAAIGRPPTEITEAWLNGVQEEICSVIEAAGLAPTSGDLGQLATAIFRIASAHGIGGAAAAIPGGNIDSATIPTGMYYMVATDTGVKPPSGGGYGHMIVSWEGHGGSIRQTIMDHSTTRIWMRFFVGGWSGWVELASRDDIAALAVYAGEGVMGFVELATHAEVAGGTDGIRAVTPAGLSAGLWNYGLLPHGLIAFFAHNFIPVGYLKANGAAVSRTAYSPLFAAIGTTFGAGDGSTTFNLPDLRGEFVRGWDDARGVDTGRGFGSFQKGTFHNIGSGPVVDCVSDYSVSNGGAAAAADLGLDTGVPSDYPNARYGSAGTVGPMGAPMYTDASYGVTRPRNIALLACIKY